jgi:hypothetical protein
MFTWWLRRIYREVMRLHRQGERIMASIDEFRILLDQVNEQTTEIGVGIADVADDINQLMAQIGSVPQEVMDGMASVVSDLRGKAAILKGVAAQFPPTPPTE